MKFTSALDSVLSFVANHTLLTGILMIVLFILYRIFIIPIIEKQKEMQKANEI